VTDDTDSDEEFIIVLTSLLVAAYYGRAM